MVQITAYGIGEVVANRILKFSLMEEFNNVVAELLKKMKEPKHGIENPTAYLVAVLKKKGINMS